MLSAQLLGILRIYWRLARPECWLFPGWNEKKPIDVQVLHSACRWACAAAGVSKWVTVTSPLTMQRQATSSRPAEDGPRRMVTKQTLYSILFRTTAETLHRIAADPRHLRAEIAFRDRLVVVLHRRG